MELYLYKYLGIIPISYTKVEKKVKLVNDERMKLNITIAPETQQLEIGRAHV